MIKNETKDNNKTLFFLLMLTCVLCWWGQFDHDEWTPDEPRVVAIALEMSQTNQWIIPHLAGQPFVEKPPLYFALAAGAIKLFPSLEPVYSVRLVNIILALLTLYFTYLLGRELMDKRRGLLAAIILGTMEGFVINFHWSRVDNLLILSLIASSWAFYVSFFNSMQRHYLLLAALFSALGFLSKGIIAVIMVGGVWLGLVAAFILYSKNRKAEQEQSHATNQPVMLSLINWHIAALLVFCLVVGSWIYLLITTGTEAIWHEWFWVNHVGRFMGTTPNLGHLHPHQPFYYLKIIAEYSLPWLPLLLFWCVAIGYKIIKKITLSPNELFIFLALVINVTLLTVSDTKRGLYLFPLLPLMAIAVVASLSQIKTRWLIPYQMFWQSFCFVMIAALLTVPLYSSFISNKMPEQLVQYFSHFNWRYLLALIIIVVVYISQRKMNLNAVNKIALSTLLFYIVTFTLLNEPLNLMKSKRLKTTSFLAKIPVLQRNDIVSFGFSETVLADFFILGNWKIPRLKTIAQVVGVLNHKNTHFSSIIVDHKGSLDTLFASYQGTEPLFKILSVQKMGQGKKNEHLIWITKH